MLNSLYETERIPLRDAFGGKYPFYFLHPAAEYRALVQCCGVIDLTHWRALRVVGRDRAAFLNAMLTNDIVSLEPGRGCHSVMTTVKGKIISEVFVFARKDEHIAVVSQGDFAETLRALTTHIVNEDVSIDDASARLGILAVEGPKAKDVIHRLLGAGPLPKSRFDSVERPFGSFGVLVVHNTASGEAGYHVMIPADEVSRIRNYLVQAARGSDGLPVGLAAWNIRRVENGLPWHGVDFSNDNFPREARLDHTVSYTKGCFRGQEALGRLHHRGDVHRLLVGLVPNSGGFPADVESALEEMIRAAERAGETELSERADRDSEVLDFCTMGPSGSPVFAGDSPRSARAAAEDEPVGTITSSACSFALRKPLFLGHVRRETLEARGALSVQTRRERLGVREIELPIGHHAAPGEPK